MYFLNSAFRQQIFLRKFFPEAREGQSLILKYSEKHGSVTAMLIEKFRNLVDLCKNLKGPLTLTLLAIHKFCNQPFKPKLFYSNFSHTESHKIIQNLIQYQLFLVQVLTMPVAHQFLLPIRSIDV